jgi:hypothetical protein
MTRHANQTKGVARFEPRRTLGTPTHTPGARVAGYTDEETVTRDAEALDKMLREQKRLKPPGVKR